MESIVGKKKVDRIIDSIPWIKGGERERTALVDGEIWIS
jgi:hypothetical protein